jgi:glycerol-3-phosphate cytidylyltransferase
MLASETDKHWHIGYVSGSFDMFHIGHLNLLRRAKERCDRLIVGVLSDECIVRNKKKAPVISLEDRLEIVRSCKYVDAVDVTTSDLLNKLAAWNKYHFDAMFTGDDHKDDGWAWEEPELNRLGAELVFFPYTRKVSSTKLRGILSGEDHSRMKKVITYGTFDLFHDGHRRLLERAKALGDYLIVGVTTEQYDIQRGKLNVVDSLMQRIDNVRNLGLADEVIIEEQEGQKIADIQKYGVSVFTVGSDWKGKFDYLKEYCEVVYLERTKHISSSTLRLIRHDVVRLGVVGAGRIAARTMDELKFVSGVNAAAVYNPHASSAAAFAKKFELDAYSDAYEQFLEHVDALYIATPHGTHYDYTKRALGAGKHVLCEKPFVLKKAEAEELFDMAASRKLVLMEAIKTAYAPGFLNLTAIVKSGKIGKIYDIEGAFTKLVAPGDAVREYDRAVGGSFTELASYPLLPIVKLLGHDYKQLTFERFDDEDGVDIYAKARFRFDHAIATVKTGIGVKSEGQLLISGAAGYILVKSPWWLIKGFDVCYENPDDNESFSAPFPGYGMRFEVADFIRNINEPDMRNYKLSRGDSIAMAAILEAFLREGRADAK